MAEANSVGGKKLKIAWSIKHYIAVLEGGLADKGATTHYGSIY